MSRPFTEEDASWLRENVGALEGALCPRLRAHVSRFPDWEHLRERLLAARDAVLSNGWSHFHGIDEAQNEILVALSILEAKEQRVTKLRYEPALAGTPQTIDFYIEMSDQPPCYVDVKTISPQSKDRWDQYEKAVTHDWLPDHATVTLMKDWLGGEIWHSMVASRGRMLEYTLELEAKIKAANLQSQTDCIALLLCSDGFHWHEDALEDFVAFYVYGSHRPDDHFSGMEMKYIETQSLSLPRVVKRFAYFERQSGATFHRRLNWRVEPPPLPF